MEGTCKLSIVYFKTLAFLACCLCMTSNALAQYAPQAGIAGSDAISKNNPAISGWATGCSVTRGLQQLGNAASGFAESGDSTLALGMANGTTVSLGDSGVAVLTFSTPIKNRVGPDFAVFENGFLNAGNGELAFLELAFVEVSSDGIHYFRFPAISKTQDTLQVSSIAGLSYLNARNLHNLAGKYIASWGTPFDLEELKNIPGLDVNSITNIRLVDVVGTIGEGNNMDSAGHTINDPFPTPFPTGGFDLDAVAVLNHATTGIDEIQQNFAIALYPNPFSNSLVVQFSNPQYPLHLAITDATGRIFFDQHLSGNSLTITTHTWPAGCYFIRAMDANNKTWSDKVFRE